MRHTATREQLERLGITPDAPARISQSARYATPPTDADGRALWEPEPAAPRLTRKRPRFYHRALKVLHKPHWYRLEEFPRALPNGELAKSDFKRGNVIAYCDPAGCGNIRFLHPFKAGEPSTPASTRGLLKVIPPATGPMRDETGAAWVRATGRA